MRAPRQPNLLFEEDGPAAAAFEQFHAANPQVYRALRSFAFEARRRGARRIGIRMAWERLRWWSQFEVNRTGSEPWRLDNNWTKFYARRLMRDEPELAGLFETRDRG